MIRKAFLALAICCIAAVEAFPNGPSGNFRPSFSPGPAGTKSGAASSLHNEGFRAWGVIPDGDLVAYYKMDGNALDSTGNNPGTFNGALTPAPNRFGEVNKAILFNGSSSYISTENAYANPGPFTVSIWFKTTTNVGGALIGFSSLKTGNGGKRDRFIYMNSAGKLIFGLAPGAKKSYITSPQSYNDGKWHMATASVGSNGMALYVDGEIVSSLAGVKTAENTTGYWRIGHGDLDTWPTQPSSFFFAGALDDALIYHRELTPEEVTDLYFPDITTSVINTCAGQSRGSFTVSASQGVPPFQYSLNSGPFSSATTFANLGAGEHQLRIRDANNRVKTETVRIGIQSLSQMPLDGAIGIYKMNAGAADETGNNPGTLQGGPLAVADRFGTPSSAYSFNGTSQYISTQNQYNNPGDFTLSIWFRTNTTTGGKLIGFGRAKTGTSTQYDRHLYMSNDGKIFFGIYPGTVQTVNTAGSYNDDKWHHALATVSAQGMRLYVDGELAGANSVAKMGENYSGYWRIGGDNLAAWPAAPASSYFKGVLDDAAIYDRALTAEEISLMYRAPDGAGNSGPVCAGAYVSLTAASFPGATYTWSGPAGYNSAQQNPVILFSNAAAGKYTVTATTPNGCVISAYTNVTGTNNPGQWTGNVSSNWNTASNWCDGLVPTSSTDVVIPATAMNMPEINGTANVRNIIISPSATLTTTSGGILQVSGLLTNKGSMVNNGTTTFNGTSGQQTFSGVYRFNHITINNPAGLILPDSIRVTNLTIQTGVLNANNNDITVGGNWTNNAGNAAFAGGTAKVRMAGSGTQIIGGSATTQFSSLYAYNTGAGVLLAGNIFISANLVIGGVLDIGGYSANRITAGGTLYLATGGHLKIGGTQSLPTNYLNKTFLIGSTVEYNGAAQEISGQNYGTLILSSDGATVIKTSASTQFSTQADFIMRKGNGSGVIFSNASDLTIGRNTLIDAGAVLHANGSLITVNGNWENNGTFNGNTGKVVLAAASASVTGTGAQNFNDLTIAGSYVTFSNHSLTLTGNFETTGQGSFTQAAGGTLTMTGSNQFIKGTGISIENLTISGTGNITIFPSLAITGNITAAAPSNVLNGTPGNVITMSGAGRTISGSGVFNFTNLNITGSITTTSNFTITGALVVEGSLTATAKTATFAGSTSVSGAPNLYDVAITTGSLKLSTNAVLGIANILTIGTGSSLDVATYIPNTVNFNGARNQNVNSITYHDLIVSNGYSKTLSGAITVNQTVTIASGTTLISGSHTHKVRTDWITRGTFVPATGTVVFNGSSNSVIDGVTTFNVLALSKATNANSLKLVSDVKAIQVDMTQGVMETGASTLEITSTRTGGGLIWGNIKRTHVFSAGISYAFGGAENTIRFDSPAGITSVIMKVEKGPAPDFPSNASIGKRFSITIPTGTYASATLRLDYEDAFLNGNDEASLEMWNKPGGIWTPAGAKTAYDVNLNFVEKSGLANIAGPWTLSGMISEFIWKGTDDSQWNKPSNWQTGGATASRVPGLYDIISIGTVMFASQPVITTSVAVKNINFGSTKAAVLTLDAGGSLTTGDITGNWTSNAIHTINTNGQNLTVSGNLVLGKGIAGQAMHLNIGSGTVSVSGFVTLAQYTAVNFPGNGTLKLGGGILDNTGTFTSGTGTVEYTGARNPTIAPLDYHHLRINLSLGQSEIFSPVLVKGDFTLAGGKVVVEELLKVRGNLAIGTGTELVNKNTIEIGGDWQNNGVFLAKGIKTLFNGTGTQTIYTTNLNNIEINKPVGSLIELAGDVTIGGNLNGISGTLDIKTFKFDRDITGGSASMTDQATLIIGANNAPIHFGNYFMAANSTIIFNGSNPQVLQLAGLTYGNLRFENSGVKKLTIPISVLGKLTIDSGARLEGGSSTLSLSGDWENLGTFDPQTSTVIWMGTNKFINGPTTFNNVTVSGSYQVTSSLTFNGLLKLTSTGVVSSDVWINYLLHGDMITSGNLDISGEAIFSGNVLQTLKLDNAVRTNIRIVTFNGTVSPDMISTTPPQFGVLNINNTGGVKPSVGWTVLSALNVAPGASFIGGPYTHLIKGNLDNQGIITSSGLIDFEPTTNVTLNFGTQFTSTNHVKFGSSGKINIAGTPVSFKTVTIENTHASGIAPSSGWTITGDLMIKSTSRFNAGGHSYLLGGSLLNEGNLASGTSTFIFNGAGDQQIRTASELYNVRLQKAGGRAVLAENLTINAELNFISGNVSTGSHIVYIKKDGVVTGASQATGWIDGRLNKYIVAGTSSEFFGIGDALHFTPAVIDFTQVVVAGGMTVSTLPTEHPAIGTSAINSARSINRYFSVVGDGIEVTSYGVTMHFAASDVDPGVNISDLQVSRYNGSSWIIAATDQRTPTSIHAADLTKFGDLAIGEICNMGTAISYAKPIFCTNDGFATVTVSGTTGGIFFSQSGLALNEENGEVNLAASQPGEYAITYFIESTASCREWVSNAVINIVLEGTWTGKQSTDWNDVNNWACGTIPANDKNVLIPTGLSNYPVLTGTGEMHDLEINGGASVKVTGEMQIHGSISGEGIMNLQDGKLKLVSSSETQIIPPVFVKNTIKDITIKNSSPGGASLGGPLNITGHLSFDGTGNTLHTNDFLTLKSTSHATASVGTVTGNTITGKVTVERFMPARKSWNLLSIPTLTTQSIKDSWQEGAVDNSDDPRPGFGIQITSSRPSWQTDGFDLYSPAPSMKTYIPATNSWLGITSTLNPINFDAGYMVFVRGNRLSNGLDKPETETTLRTTGLLKTGDQPPLSLNPAGYSIIGNPYAAPVDFTKIQLGAGVDNLFYAWDPFIAGSYNVGGYQTISAVNNWVPVPGGSHLYPGDAPASIIQSGQAVFVHTTPVQSFSHQQYTAQFKESAKSFETEGAPVAAIHRSGRNDLQNQLLRVTLFAVNGVEKIVADGNVAAFGPAYSNDIDGYDAMKMLAQGENFGLLRNGRKLAIESRKDVAETDTLHYFMANMAKRTYRLLFMPINMASCNAQAFLIDKFLRTTTPVSLADTTGVDFTVTANAASSAADRFKLVFRPMSALPLEMISVKAAGDKNLITVEWQVTTQVEMVSYHVEKSADGNSYQSVHTADAGNERNAEYRWKDVDVLSGINYYRIRGVSKDGRVSYSKTVKVVVATNSGTPTVYPNPVQNGKIRVLFDRQPAGKYLLRLFNAAGQLLITRQVDYQGGPSVELMELSDGHAKGIYTLEIRKPDGEKAIIRIIH